MESIRALLYDVGSSKPGPSAKNITTSIPELDVQDKEDLEYDKVVRELAFESRARPKDRTKTEEEIALEEMHSLQSAERKRLKRMMGDDGSDSEGEPTRKKRQRQVGGDDLDDDFYDEDASLGGLGTGLEEQANAAESEESGSDADSSEAEEDDGSGEESGDQSEGLGSDEGDEVLDLVPAVSSTKNPKAKKSAGLPFTFSCPSSHEEFMEIIDGFDDKDVPTVVQRIRTLHHPSLAEDNKFKLQVRFFE